MSDPSTGNVSGFPGDLTIVLVGSTGSGKSATGNTILDRKAFQSISSFGRVTTVCKRQAVVLEDGRVLNVIDTPGLFDSTSKPEDVQKEIAKCIQMAKDGIHAVLLVVSLKVRFSEEQVATVETLKHLFGERIADYMIVTFTGGDELEEDETLDDHLSRSCPPALKDLLEKCGNRRIVFNNKANKKTKDEQRQKLLTLITNTVVKNGGKPYTLELFVELQKETAERDSENSKQKMNKASEEEEMERRIATMINEKLKERDEEIITKLKQDVERLQREIDDQSKQQKSSQDEIQKLRTQLERARAEERAEEERARQERARQERAEQERARQEAEKRRGRCAVM